MVQQRWQLTGSGPASYERYQVPSVFEPLARIFLGRVGLLAGQRLLDLACGTGVVARLAAPIVGPSGSIAAVDLNAAMLEVARQHVPPGAPIEWRQGDAESLPFADADFDVVLCQQGLQFFPDKVGALREMHRVLRPGGRVGICVWRAVQHSPCHVAIAAALHRHLSADAAQSVQAPFTFGDPEVLRGTMAEAGFSDIAVEIEVLHRRLLPAEESIPGLIGSTPVGPAFAALDGSSRAAIVAEVAAALAQYADDSGMTVPQPTLLALATK